MFNLTKLDLNFEFNGINIDRAVKLGESISKLQNLTNLNLNFNGNVIGIYKA